MVVESNDDWIYEQVGPPEIPQPGYRPGQGVSVHHHGLRVLEPPTAANGYTLKAINSQGMPLIFQVGPGMWQVESEEPIGWPPRRDDEWVTSQMKYSIRSFSMPEGGYGLFAIPAELGRGYALDDAKDLAAFYALYPILVTRNS
jgi:hypothetical protein